MTFKLFKKYLKENPEFEREHPRVARGSSEGGEFRKVGRPSILNKEQEIEIIRRYLTKAKYPESTAEIGKKLGISAQTVNNVLKRNKIKLRPPRGPSNPYINNHAFEDAENDPKAAYWVGFIITDGYVTQDLNTLGLHLDRESRPHLEKFNNFLGYNGKISDYDRINPSGETGQYNMLRIWSPQIVHDLKKYGVVPNKTKRAAVKLLEDNPNFWRGVIDGDGSIVMTTKRLSFGSESRKIVEQFVDFVKKNLRDDFSGCIYDYPKKEFHMTRLGIQATCKILKILGYDDIDTETLEKNKTKALKLILYWKEKAEKSSERVTKIVEWLKKGISTSEISKRTGLTRERIYQIAHREGLVTIKDRDKSGRWSQTKYR